VTPSGVGLLHEAPKPSCGLRSFLETPLAGGAGVLSHPRLNLNSRRPILAGMPRKPKQPAPTSWSIYKIAKKAIWLSTVDAPDKQAAVEKAAQEFKTEAWRLYAVAQR
jgi:hypothetical protein